MGAIISPYRIVNCVSGATYATNMDTDRYIILIYEQYILDNGEVVKTFCAYYTNNLNGFSKKLEDSDIFRGKIYTEKRIKSVKNTIEKIYESSKYRKKILEKEKNSVSLRFKNIYNEYFKGIDRENIEIIVIRYDIEKRRLKLNQIKNKIKHEQQR